MTAFSICAEVVQLGEQLDDTPAVAGTDYLIQFDGAYTNINTGAANPAPGTLGSLAAVPSSLDLTPLSLSDGLVVTLAGAGVNPVTYNASLQMRPGTNVSFSFDSGVKLKKARFAGDFPTNVSWGAQSDAVSGNTYDFGDAQLAASELLTFTATSTAFRLLYVVLETLPPPPLSLIVTDRLGSNVTGTLLVDSDHIHLETASPTNIVSYSYKYAIQSTQPSPAEWDALDPAPFYEDMWFYREPTNQWVRIFVEDESGSTLDEVVGLQGGILTAPPDDPITPQEWIVGMQGGGYRNRNLDVSYDVKAEGNIVLKKKYGFKASRIHMDMEAFRTGDTARINDELRRVKMELRHGIYIAITAQGDTPPLTDPAPGTDGKPMDTYAHLMEHTSYTPEMQNLFSNAWTSVAQAYKHFSHRVAFAYFIELRNGAQYNTLEAMHHHVTPIIRAITPTRIIDYQGKSRNEPQAFAKFDLYIPALEAPYGNYFMYSFHKGFGGANDAWYRSQQNRNLNFIQPAIDYCNANPGRAVFMDVYNHTQGFYLRAQRIQHVKEFYDKLSSTPVPIPSICADFPDSRMSVDWQYDDFGRFRTNSYYSRITLEIMNGSKFVDPDDRDGDTLSNAAEAAAGTDPDWADTDYDGMYDHIELQFGFDPLDPRDGIDPWSGRYGGDADGDGILNAWEVHYPDLDPFTPNDGLTDHDSDTVWTIFETWARTEADNTRNSASNANDDTDEDGTPDVDEWAAGTNPLDDQDPDFDGLKGSDARPFVSDAANVIRYEFETGADDTALYGADNDGTLQGSAVVSNAVLHLGSGDSVTVPVTDLISSEGYGVWLRFNAVNLPHDYQVLYSENSSTEGLAIFLYGNEAWAGCWMGSATNHIRLGTVVPGQWHKVALSFDGGEGGTLSPWLTGWFDEIRPAGSPAVVSYTNLGSRSTAALGAAAGALPLTHSGLGGAGESVSDKGFAGWIDDLNVFNRPLYDIDVSMLGDRLYRFDADSDSVIDIADTFPQDDTETQDADHDGIGDNADPDDDNDGMSDADEILAGTDGNDPDSLFAISVFEPEIGSTSIHWMSVSGRTYSVDYSLDMQNWQLLPGADNIVATDSSTMITDPAGTAQQRRFYRIGIVLE